MGATTRLLVLIVAIVTALQASAASCPAGSFVSSNKCVKCAPGTFSSKATTKGPCTPCPGGTYASNSGSTKCTKCYPGSVSKAKAAFCTSCNGNGASTTVDGINCIVCPRSTTGASQATTTCLGNFYGSICCSAGNCGAQPRCPRNMPTRNFVNPVRFPTILQLVRKNVSQPACKAARLLQCLQSNAQLSMNTRSFEEASTGIFFDDTSACIGDSLYGVIVSTTKAVISTPSGTDYVLVSDKAKKTITMYLSKTAYDGFGLIPDNPPLVSACSATLRLVAGYAFDQVPPAGFKCPANAQAITIAGRSYCKLCERGEYKKLGGKCTPCRKGTFQLLVGATSCKPCPSKIPNCSAFTGGVAV